MSLRTALGDLKKELEDAANSDSEKACRINYIGMDVHEDVFAEVPPRDYVKQEVIPLLTRATNTIRLGSRTGNYAECMDHWVYVMNHRINSLREYCARKKVA